MKPKKPKNKEQARKKLREAEEELLRLREKRRDLNTEIAGMHGSISGVRSWFIAEGTFTP